MKKRSVLQDWVMELPFMQQSVLIAAMRGPDGVDKNHKSKALCKWLRRSIVISAFDKRALLDPTHPAGGSYTGPSVTEADYAGAIQGAKENWEQYMDIRVKEFLSSIDNLPHHFTLHFIHAAEILGYKHSDKRVRYWWKKTYHRFCKDMHMHAETEPQLDARLNDDESAWRADESRFKK